MVWARLDRLCCLVPSPRRRLDLPPVLSAFCGKERDGSVFYATWESRRGSCFHNFKHNVFGLQVKLEQESERE